VTWNHRLNTEVDLPGLFGLHVTWCAQLYLLADTPQLPPSPTFGLVLRGRYWSAKIDCNPLLRTIRYLVWKTEEKANYKRWHLLTVLLLIVIYLMGLPVALLLAQAGGKGERIFAPVHVALNRKYAHFQESWHIPDWIPTILCKISGIYYRDSRKSSGLAHLSLSSLKEQVLQKVKNPKSEKILILAMASAIGWPPLYWYILRLYWYIGITGWVIWK
jgi:hypothetical protein